MSKVKLADAAGRWCLTVAVKEQDWKALTEERVIGYEIEATLAGRRNRNHLGLRSLFVQGVKGTLGDRSPRPPGDRES